jgi:deazaflavin-dependent oxidoreductase (nitroreductase family)
MRALVRRVSASGPADRGVARELATVSSDSYRDRMSDFNTAMINEFRANGGRVKSGNPMVVLTTIGAKSGQPRTVPLAYLNDGGRIVIFATKAGAPTNPDWYHNLLANPKVTVELGTETFEATAEVVTGPERDRLYAAQVVANPRFGEYERQAVNRTIPVVILHRA